MTTNESKLSLTPYKRVLQIATTPTTEEFLQVAAVTGGGACLIGLLGMIIYAVMMFIPG